MKYLLLILMLSGCGKEEPGNTTVEVVAPEDEEPTLTEEDIKRRLSSLNVGDLVKDLPDDVREALFSDLMTIRVEDYCKEKAAAFFLFPSVNVVVFKGVVVSYSTGIVKDEKKCP